MKTLLVLTGVTSQMELDEELRSSGPSVRRRRFLPRGARTHRRREYGVPNKSSESWHDFWAEMEWDPCNIYIYIHMFICMYFTGSFVFLLPLMIFSQISTRVNWSLLQYLGKFEVSPPATPRPRPATPAGPPTSCPSWEASLIRGKLPAWTKSKACKGGQALLTSRHQSGGSWKMGPQFFCWVEVPHLSFNPKKPINWYKSYKSWNTITKDHFRMLPSFSWDQLKYLMRFYFCWQFIFGGIVPHFFLEGYFPVV